MRDLDPQRTTHFDELDVWIENRKINIRKMSKFLGVVELTRKEAEKCYDMLGGLLGKVDWKKEMEEDKKKFIGPKRLLGDSEIIIKKGKFIIKHNENSRMGKPKTSR